MNPGTSTSVTIGMLEGVAGAYEAGGFFRSAMLSTPAFT
jgi:hypothetical protein